MLPWMQLALNELDFQIKCIYNRSSIISSYDLTWVGGGGGMGERIIFEPQEFCFRDRIPCMNFFRPLYEYFLGLIGVHEFFFFHLIFPCANIFLYFARPPPHPPHKFSNASSLTGSRSYPHMICHWPQICHNGSRKLIWSHHRCPKLTLREYVKRGRDLVMYIFSQESHCRIKRSEVCER